MRRALPIGLALAFWFAAVSPGWFETPARATLAEPFGSPPSLGEQLRYIGRDHLTGMAAPVDDSFIAAVEESVERYGRDERQAVPPPPRRPVEVQHLVISSLGVDAATDRYGVDRFGRLDVPQDDRTIGWHPDFSDTPGEGGATFLAAHFQYAGRPGVFNKISTLRGGDEIVVTLTDGSSHRYRVDSTVDYALGAIDMGAILHGRASMESITLMTCSGPANEGEYPLRTVVMASRIDSGPDR
jgi:hypothetical protein